VPSFFFSTREFKIFWKWEQETNVLESSRWFIQDEEANVLESSRWFIQDEDTAPHRCTKVPIDSQLACVEEGAITSSFRLGMSARGQGVISCFQDVVRISRPVTTRDNPARELLVCKYNAKG